MLTPDALKSEVSAYEGEIWRIVEDQWKSATMRITDTLDEQGLLEQILDETKPPMPPEAEGYDFLIATPFRYAPYPDGSRFRRAGQPEGAFYGSESSMTAIAEMVFYRLLFFAESPETILPEKPVQYTAFSVPLMTASLLDLTAPGLKEAGDWADLTDYRSCQDLADAAREAGIEAIRYKSVRDPENGTNLSVLALRALGTQPSGKQTWHIFLRPAGAVQAWCEQPRYAQEYLFECFAADPRIAAYFNK